MTGTQQLVPGNWFLIPADCYVLPDTRSLLQGMTISSCIRYYPILGTRIWTIVIHPEDLQQIIQTVPRFKQTNNDSQFEESRQCNAAGFCCCSAESDAGADSATANELATT